MKIFILFVFAFFSALAFSQNDSNNSILNDIKFHVLIDSYNAIDLNPSNDSASKIRDFSSNSMYQDEFRLNIALLMLDYDSPHVFSSVAFQFGDIPFILTPLNKQFIKYIKRAYFGYKFNKKTSVKVGYMSNYIGYESTIPEYNFLSTASVGGYFQPSSFIGVQLQHDFSENFSASAYYYNAYHIVSKNNDNKSVGLSMNFTPAENLTFFYGNSFGNEADFEFQNQWLFYNDFVLSYSFGKFDFVGFFDFALQTNSDNDDSSKTAFMNSGMLQLRYNIHPKLNFTLRGEWFHDPNAIISDGAGDSGDFLNLVGAAFGFTFKPIDNFYFKAEYDFLASDQNLFSLNSKHRNSLIFCSGIVF